MAQVSEASLEEFGLSKNEAKIYSFLLKRGACTTGPIIKETRIASSRVYNSLNSLVAKGLATYTVQKDGKYFEAADPKKLVDIERERMKKIETLLPELIKLQRKKIPERKTAIYEGFEGFKTAFKKIIDDCPVGGTIYIVGFSEQPYATKALRTFLNNMNVKSAKKKQKLKIILDSSVRETLGKDREKEKYTQVRYMPEGYISPAAIDISEDYVYIFLWEETPFVYMIKNKRIVESFKQYFKFLWSIAKP